MLSTPEQIVNSSYDDISNPQSGLTRSSGKLKNKQGETKVVQFYFQYSYFSLLK